MVELLFLFFGDAIIWAFILLVLWCGTWALDGLLGDTFDMIRLVVNALVKYLWPALVAGFLESKIRKKKKTTFKYIALTLAFFAVLLLLVPANVNIKDPSEVASMRVSYKYDDVFNKQIITYSTTSTNPEFISDALGRVTDSGFKRTLKEFYVRNDFYAYTVELLDSNDKVIQTLYIYDEACIGVKNGLLTFYYVAEDDATSNRELFHTFIEYNKSK